MTTEPNLFQPGSATRAMMLERALNALPVAVSYVDLECRHQYLNRAALKVLQRDDASTVLGQTISEVIGPEMFAIIEPAVRRALRGDYVRFESELAGRVYVSRYMPDFDANGWARGFFGVMQDITEQRTAETALRESRSQTGRTQHSVLAECAGRRGRLSTRVGLGG